MSLFLHGTYLTGVFIAHLHCFQGRSFLARNKTAVKKLLIYKLKYNLNFVLSVVVCYWGTSQLHPVVLLKLPDPDYTLTT